MPSLQSYHTFGLPAGCHAIVTFSDTQSFLNAYQKAPVSWVLGEGSNTLFLEDFEGQVLINQILGVAHEETNTAHKLRVGGGENWHDLVNQTMKSGWWGMENLALIPGSVGAAPIQNIGAYGLEVGEFIESVELLDLSSARSFTLSASECRFGYRDSIFKQELLGKVLITHVNFTLPKQNRIVATYGELAQLSAPSPKDIFSKVIAIRRAKLPDPEVTGNAGSFFKNPVISREQFSVFQQRYPGTPAFIVDGETYKIPAAWLIDSLGFKGKELNGVQCHANQPLVLVNIGKATGAAVVEMAKSIISAVQKEFKIVLEPEVRLVGKHGLVSL